MDISEVGASYQLDYQARRIPGSRKRVHSPDEHSCEHEKCSFRITLQSESDPPSSGSESSYSVQRHDTASPKDTSDTSSSEWSSESVTMNVEFEVASLSEERLLTNDSSSGTDDLLAAVGVLAATVDDDRAVWADDSSDCDSDSSRDSEVPRADYWTCLRCKCRKNSPLFRYCEKCFQIRKDYFPERPKRTQRRRTPPSPKSKNVPNECPMVQAVAGENESDLGPPLGILTEERASGSQSVSAENVLPRSEQHDGFGSGPEIVGALETVRSCEPRSTDNPVREGGDLRQSQDTLPVSDSAIESDLSHLLQPGTSSNLSAQSSGMSNASSELCFMCVQHPRNGCFIHRNAVHILCCYTCTLKVWNRTRKCPMCNQKPLNIARAIFG